MRFGNLIFGVALLLVATTLALTITFRNAPTQHRLSAQRPHHKTPELQSRSTTRPLPASAARRSTSAPRSPTSAEQDDLEDLDLVLDDRPSAPTISAAERQNLSQRTARIRRAALAKLDKMTERFALTDEQRRKIFPLLVQSTPGYHPAMIVATNVGGQIIPVELAQSEQTPEEAIHDSLDPDQQDDFVEAQLDERAWWNEIVAQLEEDFDSAVAAGTAPPVPQDEPAEIDPEKQEAEHAPQQGDNIFDLIR